MSSKATSEDKRKHLEFIQGVINRLSSNTFLFKGWSITILGAISTATLTTGNYSLLWIILGVVLMFWAIDAYYLMLERCYRDLYNEVAAKDAAKIDYGMKVSGVKPSAWFNAARRPVLLMFYGTVLLLAIAFIIGTNLEISLEIKIKE